MHRLSQVFLGLVLLAMTSGSSLAQITFERTYGGTEWDYGYCVQTTLDGGYVVVGKTYSFGAGQTDVYLIKTDSLGDLQWFRTYGGSFDDCGYSVRQTYDRGYVIVGETQEASGAMFDIYLVKTDSLGNIEWEDSYGGNHIDFGESVLQTPDAGYVVVGGTCPGIGGCDVYILRTDSVGGLLWDQTCGGNQWDWGHCVCQVPGAGYIIAAETQSLGAGISDAYVIKIDESGNVLWERTYGGDDCDLGEYLEQTQDGGYIVVGVSNCWSDSADILLVKTDSIGNPLWEVTYGGDQADLGNCVKHTPDGGYIVVGETESFGAGQRDVFLFKTDSVGNVYWTRTYGGADYDHGECVERTADGGYVLAGHTRSFGSGGSDVYLLKTDGIGLVGIVEEGQVSKLKTGELLENQPNPFRRSTSIFYRLLHASEVTLAIYDVTGRLVETLVNETQQAGIHQVRWNRKDNPSGVYFYQLKAGEFEETRKMVLIG